MKPRFFLVVISTMGQELSRTLRYTDARVPVEGELIVVDHDKRCRVAQVQHVPDPDASSADFLTTEVLVFLEDFEAIPTDGTRPHRGVRRRPERKSPPREHGTLRAHDSGWEVITDPDLVRELMSVPPLPASAAQAPATMREGIALEDVLSESSDPDSPDTVRDGIPLRLIRGDGKP
jgi:hypothetical protein